ncbi:hypothetical protein H8957_011643 [Semnopithecus entellus]
MVIMFSPSSAVTTVIGSCCQNCLSDNENHSEEEDPTRSYGDRLFQDPHEILFVWLVYLDTSDY